MSKPDGLPRQIRFHDGKRGSIRWVQRLGPGDQAECDPLNRTTTLLKRQSDMSKAEDLIHELFHHALHPLRPLRRIELEDGGGIEEAAVKTLADHFVKIWKLNPGLFLWMHQHLTGQEVVDAEGEDSG